MDRLPGGRIGPVAYDVVSLVWHVRAGIPDAIRHRLLEVYVEALSDETGMVVGVDRFMEQLRPVLVLRLLQVLGAYGLRGITEGKAAFITPMASVAPRVGEAQRVDAPVGHAGPCFCCRVAWRTPSGGSIGRVAR